MFLSPNFKIEIENLTFSPGERKLYDSIYSDAKKNFERLNKKGLVGKNYTHILAQLMRCVAPLVHLYL